MTKLTDRFGIPYPSRFDREWYDSFRGLVSQLDSNTFGLFEAQNTILAGGGAISWTKSTSTLAWDSAFVMACPTTGSRLSVAAGSLVVADGEMVWVSYTPGLLSGVSGSLTASQQLPVRVGSIPIAYRFGDSVYFHQGLVLGDGDERILGARRTTYVTGDAPILDDQGFGDGLGLKAELGVADTGLQVLPSGDGAPVEERLFLSSSAFVSATTYAGLPAGGPSSKWFGKVTAGTAKGSYRWLEAIGGTPVQMWIPTQYSSRITDYVRDSSGNPCKLSMGVGGDTYDSLVQRGWLMATSPTTAVAATPNGFNFVSGGGGNDTIVRNDGGDWTADGFYSGGYVSVRFAEDPANEKSYPLITATASTLTVAPGSFASYYTDDNTVRFSPCSVLEISSPACLELRSEALGITTGAGAYFYPAASLPTQMLFGIFEVDVIQIGGSTTNQNIRSWTNFYDGVASTIGGCFQHQADGVANRFGWVGVVSGFPQLGHGRIDFTSFQRIFAAPPLGYGANQKLSYWKAWTADDGIHTDDVAVRGANDNATVNSSSQVFYTQARNDSGTAPEQITRLREMHFFTLEG